MSNRKGRTLTYDEINHVKRVAACLKKTIEIQIRIDALTNKWI
jgi:hypothetical protein